MPGTVVGILVILPGQRADVVISPYINLGNRIRNRRGKALSLPARVDAHIDPHVNPADYVES
jgi:hypothetical protein